MPSAMRRSKFSLKMNHAISAVAAPSSVRQQGRCRGGRPVKPRHQKKGPDKPTHHDRAGEPGHILALERYLRGLR